MTPELKPCPFCGKPAQCKVEADHHGEFYSMGCSDPGCLAHNVYYTMTEYDLPLLQAVEKWNNRV